MSRNTPDTTERRGGIKGRGAPGEGTGDSRLQGLTWSVAIRPWPGGPEHARVVRWSLPAVPVSGAGLTTRHRRGAAGGHVPAVVCDYPEDQPEMQDIQEE
ncbi:hypothetical protein [Pantoea sp.]|uniref:hypothetical protein n=1 Tax=Pantoea sp. TaxID=69393 RepID=UPI0028A88B08|nr:hypothetical protein [Pantoea sp.]